MRLVFIHSGEKIKKDTLGNLYTDGSYDKDVWNMYLKIFSEITIVMREDEKVYSVEEAKRTLNIIPTEKIKVCIIPNIYFSFFSFINLRLRFKEKKIIENEIDKADAVIVRIPGVYSAIEYAQKKEKPCLVEVVACPFDSLWNYNLKGKILAPFAYLKMRKAIEDAPNLIYVTNKFLQKRYPTKGKNIGCSDVRILNFEKENLKKNSSFKRKLILGTIGNVETKYKGQKYVIKALSNLKKLGNNNFEYHLVGGGNPKYLKKLINKYSLQNEVKFIGSVPHNYIFKWYKSLDLYIQPSKQEGLPRALVEAMSCGIPCLGSTAGGIPELLDKDSIFQKGNIIQIQNLLLKTENEYFRKEKAQKCFEKSKNYELRILEQKRIDFMKQIFRKDI